MLSQERKAQMIESLKKDYVVLTGIVVEVVADIQADMIVIKEKTGGSTDMEADKKKLYALNDEYTACYETNQVKAVDIIEQLYELNDKYDKLRMDLYYGR